MSSLIPRFDGLSMCLTLCYGGMTLPFPASAGDPSITLQRYPTQIELTAHGITGDRVSIETSDNLKSWSTLSGVVLGPTARAKARDMPGWNIPIAPDGSMTFTDSAPRAVPTKFYRARSTGAGWGDARQAWIALQVREYRYHFRRSCFCFGPPGDAIVHVRDGKVIAVEELSTPRLPPSPVPGDPALYPTIDGLFDLLDQFVRNGADVIQFSLDPQVGFPASISVDRLLGAIDDEVAYSVSEFQRVE